LLLSQSYVLLLLLLLVVVVVVVEEEGVVVEVVVPGLERVVPGLAGEGLVGLRRSSAGAVSCVRRTVVVTGAPADAMLIAPRAGGGVLCVEGGVLFVEEDAVVVQLVAVDVVGPARGEEVLLGAPERPFVVLGRVLVVLDGGARHLAGARLSRELGVRAERGRGDGEDVVAGVVLVDRLEGVFLVAAESNRRGSIRPQFQVALGPVRVLELDARADDGSDLGLEDRDVVLVVFVAVPRIQRGRDFLLSARVGRDAETELGQDLHALLLPLRRPCDGFGVELAGVFFVAELEGPPALVLLDAGASQLV